MNSYHERLACFTWLWLRRWSLLTEVKSYFGKNLTALFFNLGRSICIWMSWQQIIGNLEVTVIYLVKWNRNASTHVAKPMALRNDLFLLGRIDTFTYRVGLLPKVLRWLLGLKFIIEYVKPVAVGHIGFEFIAFLKLKLGREYFMRKVFRFVRFQVINFLFYFLGLYQCGIELS